MEGLLGTLVSVVLAEDLVRVRVFVDLGLDWCAAPLNDTYDDGIGRLLKFGLHLLLLLLLLSFQMEQLSPLVSASVELCDAFLASHALVLVDVGPASDSIPHDYVVLA